jgi:hypothetical protein
VQTPILNDTFYIGLSVLGLRQKVQINLRLKIAKSQAFSKAGNISGSGLARREN